MLLNSFVVLLSNLSAGSVLNFSRLKVAQTYKRWYTQCYFYFSSATIIVDDLQLRLAGVRSGF